MSEREALVQKLNDIKKRCDAVILLLEGNLEVGVLPVLSKIADETKSLLDLLSHENARKATSVQVAGESREPHDGTSSYPYDGNLDDIIIGFLSKAWGWISNPGRIVQSLVNNARTIGLAVTITIVALSSYSLWDYFYLSRHGLTGQYFRDEALQNAAFIRKDSCINFAWGRRGPGNHLKPDHFSVRWTGFLVAPADGNYSLLPLTDDGVRLWIDDQLLIDDWHGHKDKWNKGDIRLARGHHSIRVEYFQGVGGSTAKLYWQEPWSKNRKIITPKYLIPGEKYL